MASVLEKLTGFFTLNDPSFVQRSLIGLGAEIENNLFVTVLGSDGNPISTATIRLVASVGNFLISTQSEIETAVDENGRFQMFVDNSVTITITVFDVDEGERSITIDHDGVTNLFVTISFVPTILRFPEANPIRIVYINSPQLVAGSIQDTFHIDHSDPFFESDRYYLKIKKGKALKMQFVSNYLESNYARVFDSNDNQVGDLYSATPKVDLISTLGYVRYEFNFDFSTIADGVYYLKFEGSDLEQGTYEAKSEPFLLKNSHRGTVEITYKCNQDETAYDIDFSTGIELCLLFEGEFWRTKFGGDKTTFVNDDYSSKKLWAVKRKYSLLKVHGVPHYLLDKINLALDHDIVKINNQEVVTEEDLEPEIEEHLSLVKAESWIPFKGAFVNRQGLS